jgi:hypothetical protein
LGAEFTEPARSLDDLASLASIRASLVARVQSGLAGGTWNDAGESHWLVVPAMRALVQSRSAVGVGFFGQARENVDHGPILRLEHELLDRAPLLPGLLAYYNVRFASGQWGNLVMFGREEDPGRTRSDPTHLEALARTADHYRSVRLHRLRFPEGALRGAAAHESTLLIDFTQTPPWRATHSGLPFRSVNYAVQVLGALSGSDEIS